MEMSKFYHIFFTGCSGSCHSDNFRCGQWKMIHQNNISVSVYEINGFADRIHYMPIFIAKSSLLVCLVLLDKSMSCFTVLHNSMTPVRCIKQKYVPTASSMYIQTQGAWFNIWQDVFNMNLSNTGTQNYWVLKCLYHFEIWWVPRQHCCWGTCQISEWLENSKQWSYVCKTLRDCMIWHMWYWNGLAVGLNMNTLAYSCICGGHSV